MWLPQKEVLIEIGLVYEAFPALTTMRGSGQRNPLDYINSLKTCRSLNADYLVALHGPNPVTAGEENVRQYLTNFSDAIQFMHDQTVQYMNRGYTPGEIEELLALPPHLASSPYLQETYGSMEWDVHHIFRYYRGYYTGEIRDLFPQSALSEAQMSAELAGGVAELASKAEDARVNGNLEWALRLADDVLILDPGHPTALETKKAAMLALAEGTMNSQARNMLLSEYLLLTGQVPAQFPFGDPQAIFSRMGENAVLLMPLETAHRILAVNLNASKSIAMNVSMDIRFTDIHCRSATGSSRWIRHPRRVVILSSSPPRSSGRTWCSGSWRRMQPSRQGTWWCQEGRPATSTPSWTSSGWGEWPTSDGLERRSRSHSVRALTVTLGATTTTSSIAIASVSAMLTSVTANWCQSVTQAVAHSTISLKYVARLDGESNHS